MYKDFCLFLIENIRICVFLVTNRCFSDSEAARSGCCLTLLKFIVQTGEQNVGIKTFRGLLIISE